MIHSFMTNPFTIIPLSKISLLHVTLLHATLRHVTLCHITLRHHNLHIACAGASLFVAALNGAVHTYKLSPALAENTSAMLTNMATTPYVWSRYPIFLPTSVTNKGRSENSGITSFFFYPPLLSTPNRFVLLPFFSFSFLVLFFFSFLLQSCMTRVHSR